MIEQYIRDKRGRKRGIMVAKALSNDSYTVGFSIANVSQGDVFNRKRGLEVAEGRADSDTVRQGCVEAGPNSPYEIVAPMGFASQIENFVVRSARFFKDRKAYLTVVTNRQVPTEEEKVELGLALEEASAGGSGNVVTRLQE